MLPRDRPWAAGESSHKKRSRSKQAGRPRACEVEAGMRQHSPRDDQASEPLIRRLDRAADGINPLLLILMVGLVILIAVRVATIGLANLPISRVDPSCQSSPVSAAGGAGVVDWAG